MRLRIQPKKQLHYQEQAKIIEIKDVKSLSNTKQIRGERQVAQGTGKDFTIITGEKTHVSGNIPTKEIRRRNDIGPQ